MKLQCLDAASFFSNYLRHSHCLVHTGSTAFQFCALSWKGMFGFILSTALAVPPSQIVLLHKAAHSAALLLISVQCLDWKVRSPFNQSTHVTNSDITVILVLFFDASLLWQSLDCRNHDEILLCAREPLFSQIGCVFAKRIHWYTRPNFFHNGRVVTLCILNDYLLFLSRMMR